MQSTTQSLIEKGLETITLSPIVTILLQAIEVVSKHQRDWEMVCVTNHDDQRVGYSLHKVHTSMMVYLLVLCGVGQEGILCLDCRIGIIMSPSKYSHEVKNPMSYPNVRPIIMSSRSLHGRIILVHCINLFIFIPNMLHVQSSFVVITHSIISTHL